MKQITMAIGLAWAAVVAITAQTPAPKDTKSSATPVIRCKGPDGRACTAKQVQALLDGVYGGKQQHDVLTPVKSITLASADGNLKCEQDDGKPCTTAQLDGVKLIAADQKLFLNYNTTTVR